MVSNEAGARSGPLTPIQEKDMNTKENGLPIAPCVGENVVWYPHGDINQEPHAATVTQRMNDECITLYTLSPTGRREPMLNVRHINSPFHDSSPHGLRWGAWDLVGEHEKRVAEEKEMEEARRKEARDLAEDNISISVDIGATPDENDMIIIRFAREFGEVPGRAQLIADKIGADMTHQRVNAVLRKFPGLLSGVLPEELIDARI